MAQPMSRILQEIITGSWDVTGVLDSASLTPMQPELYLDHGKAAQNATR